jgi:Na+-transporting NADH:ubiquinone oxidoreductase subunit NqrF
MVLLDLSITVLLIITLKHHEAPEDIELYFCGPPLMNQAVQKMGEDLASQMNILDSMILVANH